MKNLKSNYHSCATEGETGRKDVRSPLKDKWKPTCGTLWRKTGSLGNTRNSFQTNIACTEHVVLLMTRFCVHVLHINKLINRFKRHMMKIIIHRILSEELIRHLWRRGVSLIQVAGQLMLWCWCLLSSKTPSMLFSCHTSLMKKPKRKTRSVLSQSVWPGRAEQIWFLWELGFEADPGAVSSSLWKRPWAL